MASANLAEKEKDKERKGAGFFVGVGQRLGLASAPKVASQAGMAVGSTGAGAPAMVLVRGASIGLPQTGFFGTLLATRAGTVALLISGFSVAIGLGVLLRGVFLQRARAADPTGQLWARLPQRQTRSEASPGAAGASGSSLDIMAQAAQKDAWLQSLTKPQEEVSAPANAAKPKDYDKSPKADAPPKADGLRDSVGPKASLPQMGGLATQNASGSVGGIARPSGSTFSADAASVYGLTPMKRDKTGMGLGRRTVTSARGMTNMSALRRAMRDGLGQKRSNNPSMQQAGTTFDGAASAIQGSPGGFAQPGSFGGTQAPKNGLSTNGNFDSSQVPGPIPPVGGEKESTPYKWAMIAAVAGLFLAMLLAKMAGSKKEAANKIPATAEPTQLALKAQLLASAASLHWMAAAAAGGSAAMGGVMMQNYDQKMQGVMFIMTGGMLALFNIKAALDASKASKDAQAKADEAAKTDVKIGGDEQAKLHQDRVAPPQEGGGGGDSGGGMQPPQLPQGGQEGKKEPKKEREKPQPAIKDNRHGGSRTGVTSD